MTVNIHTPSFFLSIVSHGSHTDILAVPDSSGKFFKTIIDHISIAQITNNLFESVADMIQGFEDAADCKYPGLLLDFDSQGKLIYKAVLSTGSIKKEYSFTLELKEDVQVPLETLEKELVSREQWIENIDTGALKSLQISHEKRFDKLEDMILQLTQKLESLCPIQKTSTLLQNETYFNEASVDISNYALSDNNRTAKLIKQNLPVLELLPQISTSGQYSYSLQMNNDNMAFLFGIQAKSNYHDEVHKYELMTSCGSISGKVSKASEETCIFPKKGDILKMVVDMDKGTLHFFADGKVFNSCSILRDNPYYALIRLMAVGDSVTLI